MSGPSRMYRYSEAFKQKVVSEIERGQYSIGEAKDIYELSPTSIRSWIRQRGKNDLIRKVIKVEMKNEADKIKQLEREKRELESALAQAHLKILTLESTIEVAQERYHVDLKKSTGSKGSKKVSQDE